MIGRWFLIFLMSVTLIGAKTELFLGMSNLSGEAIEHVEQGIPFILSLTIKGNHDGSGPIIDHLNRIDHYERLPVSTMISIVNGKQETQKKYGFKVRIDDIGSFSLGPAHIEKNNKMIQSQALAFDVIKSSHAYSETSDPFIRLEINKEEVFVGEQLLFSLRIYFKKPILKSQITSFSLNKFALKQLGNSQREDVEYEGTSWQSMVYHFALYPKVEGDLLIPSIMVKCEREKDNGYGSFMSHFRSFFGAEIEVLNLQSQPIEIKVKPLPAQAQNMVVGQFDNFVIKAEQTLFKQNKGTTITLSLRGAGNVGSLNFAPHWPDDVRVYKSSTQLVYEGDGMTMRTSEWIIQPLRDGDIVIPEQSFTYFDPVDLSKKMLRTRPLKLHIEPVKSGGFFNLKSQHDDPKIPWPEVPIWLMVLLSLVPFLILIGWYIGNVYKEPIVRLVRFYRFKRQLVAAAKQKNANKIYHAWINLLQPTFGEELALKRFVDIGLLVLPQKDRRAWQDYVSLLEKGAFNERDSLENVRQISQISLEWFEKLKVFV